MGEFSRSRESADRSPASHRFTSCAMGTSVVEVPSDAETKLGTGSRTLEDPIDIDDDTSSQSPSVEVDRAVFPPGVSTVLVGDGTAGANAGVPHC